MRRTVAILLSLTLAFGLTACGTGTPNTTTQPNVPASGAEDTAPTTTPSASESAPSSTTGSGKTLVVYFSMPETTDPNNMTEEEENSAVVIDGKVLGNTQYVAMLIQEALGANLYRIEPETPYPTDHEVLVDQASEEQSAATRPAIKEKVENIADYDTIFLGYPNWWGDMPMILYTFLEEYDLSGKTIVPFNTHGGSGFSNTISTIAELQPDATVVQDGFTVSRNNVADAKEDVLAWLSDNGYQQ